MVESDGQCWQASALQQRTLSTEHCTGAHRRQFLSLGLMVAADCSRAEELQEESNRLLSFMCCVPRMSCPSPTRPHQRIDVIFSSLAQHPLPVLSGSNPDPNGRALPSMQAPPNNRPEPCRDPDQQPPSAQDILTHNSSRIPPLPHYF